MPKLLLLFSFFLICFFIDPTICKAEQQNSFEIFWPITAGKTVDESGYNLKRFKENLRGMLIIGKLQKANYSIDLGTKRLLEAEKLMNKNNTEPSCIALAEADAEFVKAQTNFKDTKLHGGKTKVFSEEVKPKLEKVSIFLKLLRNNSNTKFANKVLSVDQHIDLFLSEIN